MRAVQVKNNVYVKPFQEKSKVHIGFFRRFLSFDQQTFFIDNRDYVRMEITEGLSPLLSFDAIFTPLGLLNMPFHFPA